MSFSFPPSFYTDFCLLASDSTRVQCHKAVMASVSPVISVFLERWSNNTTNECIYDLSEYSAQALQNVVNYIYNNQLLHPDYIVESLDVFKFLNITIDEKVLYNTLSDTDLLKIAVGHQHPTMDLLSSLVENLNNDRDCVLVLMSFDAELVCQYMWQHVCNREELDSFKYYARIARAIFTMFILEDVIPLRIPYDRLISLISVILACADYVETDMRIPSNSKMSKLIKIYRFAGVYQMNHEKLKTFMDDAEWICNLLKL